MIKYLQLPVHFDAVQMQQELSNFQNKDWQLHYQKLHYEGEWSAIPLRSIYGDAENILISPQENSVYEDTSFLKISPYYQEVLSFFKCPLQAVRLLNLKPGAVIKEHRDAELNFEKGEIRIHIPVVTNEQVEFYLDKERIYLKEGECWYMNFNLRHSLVNNSKADRVHLVIDAIVNDWVKDLFLNPDLLKKEIDEPGYDLETKNQIIKSLREINSEISNLMADEMEASS